MDNGSQGLMFENQIEIENIGQKVFAQHGDSGSLVVDQEGCALGLLFAVSEYSIISYANPIEFVLNNNHWNLELALS
jgi:hypothetical protein